MKKSSRILIGGLLVIFGCGCFLYPNFRELRTQHQVDEIINTFNDTYDEPYDTIPPGDDTTETSSKHFTDSNNAGESAIEPEKSQQEEDLNRPYDNLYKEMLDYNHSLATNGQHIVDAWSYEQEPFNLSLIDSNNPIIGYIEIPDMDIRLPLMLGASPENLKKGAAVLSETSMPIGGENTNCVIAGHRGWEGSAYFQFVENMEIGSKVYITNPWETLVYECTETKIIYPDDVSSILIQDGKDMITLFTCHPYVLGGGPYRYLVFCERVDTVDRNTDNDVKVINPKINKDKPLRDTEVKQQIESHELSEAQIRSESKIDWLALEHTLRTILPITIIALVLIILLTRALSVLLKRKNKKKILKNKEKR